MASIGSLPDDLLAAIFVRLHMHLRDRQHALVLVCRRWWQVANSPELLRQVTLPIAHLSPPALESLRQWLALRAAPHVQQLSLTVDSELVAQAATVRAVILACSVSGSLQRLNLHAGTWVLPLGSWLAPLGPSLRVLSMEAFECGIHVSGSLAGLTALQELELRGPDGVTVDGAARLPLSLTRLHLDYVTETELPWQVGSLTNLRELIIGGSVFLPEGCHTLVQLSRLERLELGPHYGCLPSCLSKLTWLRSLAILGEPTGNEEADNAGAVLADLAEAVQQMRQLTQLVLSLDMPEPPASLAFLSSLQRLHWGCSVPGATLLPGPWPALRTLALPYEMLLASLPALGAPHRLEHLGAFQCAANSAFLGPILRWAADHPHLHRLMASSDSFYHWDKGEEAQAALKEARQSHPGLRIQAGEPVYLFGTEYYRCFGEQVS